MKCCSLTEISPVWALGLSAVRHQPTYMTLLIAFAVLSILVSFNGSILEAALLSLTPRYIAQQKAGNLSCTNDTKSSKTILISPWRLS